VREFVTHRKTGLMVPFLQPEAVADAVLTLLEDQTLAKRLRRNARSWAEKHLAMDDYIAGYRALIKRVIQA
jgi:glycosyltransferase involved in cell wall biosynthesis